MSDVELYIARFSPETQKRLASIRAIAMNAFPDASEKLYYGNPTIFVKEEGVLFYAAYKDYISICVGYDWVDFLKSQYPQFGYTRATIQFPHKDPLPEDMVQVICALLKQGLAEGTLHAK